MTRKVAKTLDCRGLLCPLPVLRTRSALEFLGEAEILKLMTTDPVADLDVTAFADEHGHEIVERRRDGDERTFWIRKGAISQAEGVATANDGAVESDL